MTDDTPAPPGRLEVRRVPLSALRTHPRNPRRGNVEAIEASLSRFGQYVPLLVQAGTGYVLAGNHRLEAARRLGWEEIDAVYRECSDEEALEILLADNRTSERGATDVDALLAALEDLAPPALEPLGFPEDHLADLREEAAHPFRTERVNVADLRPHPRNYQEHPEDQLAEIARSLDLHGFYRNIVIARDGTILAGHGVVAAARSAGRTRVPVIRLDLAPDDPRALRVLTADNEIGRLAVRDDRALTELLRGIMEADGDLLGTGYTEERLAALVYVTRPQSEVRDLDAAAEWVGMPAFAPEDPWPWALVIRTATPEQREEVCRILGIERPTKMIGKTEDGKGPARHWTARWPWSPREDLAALRFD